MGALTPLRDGGELQPTPFPIGLFLDEATALSADSSMPLLMPGDRSGRDILLSLGREEGPPIRAQSASIRTSIPPVMRVRTIAIGAVFRITSPSIPSWSITAAALMILAGAIADAIPPATAWAE